jgi:putative glycosyltransferase (TIGR04348 family)
MKVILITPARKSARAGNRTTAQRWARRLRELGHRVRVQFAWDGAGADLMVALHAWRSADSILRFRERFPARPLVVALTGTDIYRFQQSHRQETLRSMQLADAITCLHDLVHEAIPAAFAKKLHVIHQSALPLSRPRAPSARSFDICVLGHLRQEKDPLRAAYAIRDLPAASRIRLLQFGRAHSEQWANRARDEMARNPRYHWLGEAPGWRMRREFGKTHLMVLSSLMEGGANVISEAVVAGVPIIASEIHGTIGLLGQDFGGYFPAKNTRALRALLLMAERNPDFVAELAAQGAARRYLFTVERERAAWATVLQAVA